ncbi:cobalamin biosynthesis protein [Streptomyces chumphonensis]|uniref:cobalamin biosynthesis protein n=1 Tax=Streptomyces chumphonensis TaxID=1214925 RepID=UPI003D74FED5
MAAPGRVTVGIGARRGAAAEEVLAVVAAALWRVGLPAGAVECLATVEARAAEPGLVAAAGRLGVPLRGHSAAALAEVPVPNPSALPAAALGTPSVAEAAALLGAGPGAELLVAKLRSAPLAGGSRVTCAVAGRPPR